jgi:hypothetical protein
MNLRFIAKFSCEPGWLEDEARTPGQKSTIVEWLSLWDNVTEFLGRASRMFHRRTGIQLWKPARNIRVAAESQPRSGHAGLRIVVTE